MTYTKAISKIVRDNVQHCDIQCETLNGHGDFQEKLNGLIKKVGNWNK